MADQINMRQAYDGAPGYDDIENLLKREVVDLFWLIAVSKHLRDNPEDEDVRKRAKAAMDYKVQEIEARDEAQADEPINVTDIMLRRRIIEIDPEKASMLEGKVIDQGKGKLERITNLHFDDKGGLKFDRVPMTQQGGCWTTAATILIAIAQVIERV